MLRDRDEELGVRGNMIRSFGLRVRLVAVVTVLALVATLGASVASAAAPPGVNTEGTGPSPKGAGLLSKAALAQDTCTEGGRTNFYYAGNGPFCVNPWADGKDNGGATAPGVTATTVKVVGYFSNEEMLAQSGEQPPKNSVTGERVTWEKVVEDQDQAWNTLVEQLGTFQLWGRKPEIEVVIASGPDETAQRADALAVLEKNPFMVFDLASPSEGGSAVFSSVVAQRKVITWSASTTPEIAAQQSPYRWSVGQDPNSIPTLTAAFLGRTLSGKKAQWAGDEAMTKKTRVFGAVYPNSNFDFAGFEQLLKQNGGSALADSAEYDPDPARSAEQAATFVTKLKSKGVTTVVLFATSTMVGPLMKAATDQEYKPEWILTGSGYHDYPLFPRTWDQEQAAHAFGTGVLSPNFSGPTPAGGMDVDQVVLGVGGRKRRREHRRVVPRPLPVDPLRGPDADGSEPREGSVLSAGLRRRRRRHDGVAQRLRQDRRHALRRERLVGVRQRAHLVESRGHHRRPAGQGRHHVHERRQTLRLRRLPEARTQVLRRGLAPRRHPDRDGLRGRRRSRGATVQRLPELGRRGVVGRVMALVRETRRRR